YGAVLVWVGAYALLATAAAVLLRSVPLAVAVSIAWAGPIEHLLQDAWTPAGRLFPGLLLEAFIAGGTIDVTASQALLRLLPYVALAGAVAGTAFARRDLTA
ncbi:MAG: ABC transporter permease, partial [Actinomycetota bacterium]|nr:ABC transporter permease [Actinomycetota bacterium]